MLCMSDVKAYFLFFSSSITSFKGFSLYYPLLIQHRQFNFVSCQKYGLSLGVVFCIRKIKVSILGLEADDELLHVVLFSYLRLR
jgi:hypothetical protein